MNLKKTARALSEIEVKTLKALKEHKKPTLKQIAKEAKISIDSVRRALAWLLEKELVSVHGGQKLAIVTEKGLEAIENNLPERTLVKTLEKVGGKEKISELQKKCPLQKNQFNAALGNAKKMNWIEFKKGKVELTGIEKEELPEEKLLKKAISGSMEKKAQEKKFLKPSELSAEEKNALNRLIERNLVELKEYKMSSLAKAKIKKTGLKALEIATKTKHRAYNVKGEVPTLFIGKKQPYVKFLEQIREKLIRMGFKETRSPYIVQEFYNFDVLFQPQNHPARSWASTYQLKNPKKGKLPEKKYVNAIKKAHENGGNTESTGWGYEWSEEIAGKVMPAAHGTAHSARQLIKGVELPSKYFSIARCFRPDTVDRTHLIEFNQLEGIIAGELSFKHLLGMLKQFAEEIAHAKKVKFFPDYYPFTSPSVQLSALHPEMGWVEFGGAGLFRPEMLKPLGIDCQVLAWGLGIDRLAMFKLGIDDVRELFSQKLDWLRESKLAVLE